MSRSRLIALLTLVVALAGGATAGAQTVTTTTGNSHLAALGGWLVWSEPGAGGWRLVGLKDGVKRTFPVAARPQPFDVDLGTDAGGATVATFTRCATYPAVPGGLDRAALFGAGCHVRVLSLASGRERSAGIPRPKDATDGAPSMWRGAVAFARSRPGDQLVQRIWRYHPETKRLEAMPRGPVPQDCPYKNPADCRRAPHVGHVLSLDLGARLLTYQWHVLAPSVAGSGGGEVVQAVALKTGHVQTLGSGTNGEACTGGIDGSVPEAPVALGLDVWYLQRASACTRFYAWAQRGTFGGGVGQADLGQNTVQATTDGHALYLTLAPEPPAQPGVYALPDYRCDRPGAPCAIERVPFPALTPLGRAPRLSTF